MSRSKLFLAVLLMTLAVPLLAAPASAAGPVATTTVLVSPTPPAVARTGQSVTFTAKVTAEDGSVPQGVVFWDDAGACQSEVAEAPVDADGTATMSYTHDTPYDSYSLNACFRPTDSDVYQSSEDFSCCLDVGPTATTTVLVSPTPPAVARTGQSVTFTAKVTAEDGSVPQGVVFWDDAGACQSEVAEAPVDADGTATMSYTHDTPYDSYSLNACFRPTDSDVYQSSEDFSCCLDVGPTATTTVLVSPTPPAVARTGQSVTFTAKVTAEDGSVPQGVVFWDDAGACQSEVAEAPVDADGTATMSYTHDTPYDSYSLNACFRPTDSDVYQSSEDFSCCLDVGPTATTTVLVSPTPPAVARTGQSVTFTAKVTAEDGSVPQGVVFWDDAGACQSEVAEAPVDADGTATMSYTHDTPYDSYSLNACFRPTDSDVYQSSEDFSCCLDVGPVSTSTSITSVTPAGGSKTGQTVTMKVALSAGDGSSPQGTVEWQTTGACGSGSPAASTAVGPDGTATLTHSFLAAGTYELRACFSATDPGQYQNSEHDNGSYAVTKPVPPKAPVVTEQPSSVVAVAGRPVTFSADATGSPAPSVQWQLSRNGGDSWSNVVGATDKTLSLLTGADDSDNWYRAVFTNAAGKVSTRPGVLLVTHAFRGFSSPAPRTSTKPGSSLLVAFTLGGPNRAQLDDAIAKTVPTLVQLRSPRSGLVAQTSCTYDVPSHRYLCTLEIPPRTSSGTYRLLALTRLGTGPWVPAIPVTTARNPQRLIVAR